MIAWVKRSWVAIVYLALVVAFAIGIGYVRRADIDRIARVSHASCERGNVIRTQFNIRGVAINVYVNNEINLALFQINDPSEPPQAVAAARMRIDALKKLRRAFKSVQLANCG